MRIFEINQNSVNRVCLIPNLTYQNTAFWFDQTRRDWQLDLLLPFDYAQQPAHPVIIWLSGGSWQMMDRQSYLPELTFLARAGYVVASMDYHLGAQGAFPMQIKDVRQALAYLKTQQAIYHLDLNQVTLMGDSAGGHLALLTAYTMQFKTLTAFELGPKTPIQQVVGYYAPTDLQRLTTFYDKQLPKDQQFDYVAPINFLLRQQTATKAQLQAASPIHYVQANLPRTLLLQGDADQWVPFEQALYLTQALQAAGNQAELFKLNQGQHVDPRFFAPVINQNVLAFLQNK